MVIEELNAVQSEFDRLLSNNKKLLSESKNDDLDGYAMALRHIRTTINTANKILEKKIYSKEYNKIK